MKQVYVKCLSLNNSWALLRYLKPKKLNRLRHSQAVNHKILRERERERERETKWNKEKQDRLKNFFFI